MTKQLLLGNVAHVMLYIEPNTYSIAVLYHTGYVDALTGYDNWTDQLCCAGCNIFRGHNELFKFSFTRHHLISSITDREEE